jgi:Kef-type K+ transport system membrane component KefB
MLLLICCFVAFMLLAVRPLLRWWMSQRYSLLSNPLPVAMALALGSAWVTASLGLHPVFGGFLAGLTMPRADGTPDADVLRPLEEVSGLLLPLFFIVTGLSLNIGALDGAGFAVLALVCAIAIIGKVVPAYVASRIGGIPPREAAAVAALVNTRGLTELIVLNLGLSAGLINEELFSILVLMALITTALTGPLLSLIRMSAAAPGASERSPVALPPPGYSEP